MEKGKFVQTPRFGNVKIAEVFKNRQDANNAGYTEPTHYYNDKWTVLGKIISCHSPGWCKMHFAAVRES